MSPDPYNAFQERGPFRHKPVHYTMQPSVWEKSDLRIPSPRCSCRSPSSHLPSSQILLSDTAAFQVPPLSPVRFPLPHTLPLLFLLLQGIHPFWPKAPLPETVLPVHRTAPHNSPDQENDHTSSTHCHNFLLQNKNRRWI